MRSRFFFRCCFSGFRAALLSLFFLPLLLCAGKQEIIATADLHGEIGKLARLAPLFREHPDAIKVDAGDLAQGDPAVCFFDGMPMIDALNALSYDAFVPGNHDFEMGEAVLARWQKRFSGRILCAQCRSRDFCPAPYTVLEKNGFRCAVIGLTEHKLMQTPALLPEWTLESDTLSALDRALQELSALSPAPDLILLVWHNGRYSSLGKLGQILSARPEIDAVICAHTHEEIRGAKTGNAVIVQPGAHGDAAVLLTFHRDEEHGKWITSALLRPGDKTDSEISLLAGNAECRAEKEFARPLGCFSGSRDLAEQAAEALRRHMACDAAVFDAPDTDLAGTVTLGRFLTAFPYNNRYFAVSLSQNDLKRLAAESPGKGRFRVVAGSPAGARSVTVAVSDYLLRSSPELRRKKIPVLRAGATEREIPCMLIDKEGQKQ